MQIRVIALMLSKLYKPNQSVFWPKITTKRAFLVLSFSLHPYTSGGDGSILLGWRRPNWSKRSFPTCLMILLEILVRDNLCLQKETRQQGPSNPPSREKSWRHEVGMEEAMRMNYCGCFQPPRFLSFSEFCFKSLWWVCQNRCRNQLHKGQSVRKRQGQR